MVIISNKKSFYRSLSIFVIILCGLLTGSYSGFAQDDDRYLDYRRWGLHMNNVMYRPAYAKKLEGVYDIDPQPMRGYNVGITYTFRRERQLSYYTGLDMDFIPFMYYYYSDIPVSEIPNGTFPLVRDYDKWINDHNVLTVPLGISWRSAVRKHHYNNLFYTLSGDIRFHFIQPGDMGATLIVGNAEIFNIYAASKPINLLSPTINLSCGMQWLSAIAIVDVKLNIQKGIVPYLQGGYSYYNLKQSPDTKGVYKVRADYVGIDVGIRPKKWRKRTE